MFTNLIHIGDVHAAPGPRNADRFRALDQIIAEGCALDILGAWLLPGDLNHARMTIEDRNALAGRLMWMASRAPVVICYGNHDAPGDLDVFAKLKTDWPIYVVDTPRCVSVLLADNGGQATIFVLPYPTKAGLVTAGIAHGDLIPTASDALDAIFMQAAADLDVARARGDLTLMIGHVNVAGSTMSAGQPNVGHEIEIGPQQLARLGPIYKGLNHIHVAQDLHGAYYAGSICRLSWGEIEPKSYLVITYDSTNWKELTAANIPSMIERRPIDVAPMYHVEGELTAEGFTWRCTAGPGGVSQEPPRCVCAGYLVDSTILLAEKGCLKCCGSGVCWHGCEVRVRVRFKQSARSILELARVRGEFEGALRLEIEPIATPDRDIRAPEVALVRTLPEKLAVYAKVADLTPGQLGKLAALEHHDPQRLLSDVAAEMARLEGREKASVAA